jgi:predicted DNA-binding protein with PD1-like motif
MSQTKLLEITTGRIATVRLGPNEDLIEGLDQAAAQLGFRHALVRSGLGSLIDATFEGEAGEPRRLSGPAIEILALSGEIAREEDLFAGPAVGVSGLVGDTTGAVWSGRFISGQNPVCVTVEAVLEEILPAR